MEKIKFLEEQIQAQNIIDKALKKLPLIDKITLFMWKNFFIQYLIVLSFIILILDKEAYFLDTFKSDEGTVVIFLLELSLMICFLLTKLFFLLSKILKENKFKALFMLKNKIKKEDYQFLIKKLNEDVRNNEQSFLKFYLDRKRVVRKLEKQINKIKKEEFDKLKIEIILK